MIKTLRQLEVGNYVVVLKHYPPSDVFGFPDGWDVITGRCDASFRFGFKATRQRKKTFVSGATAFNKTVARIRDIEEKRLLATPMIPEVVS